MTPELLSEITKEAEEKYPFVKESIDCNPMAINMSHSFQRLKREVYIQTATAWAEKIEAIRAEVDRVKENIDVESEGNDHWDAGARVTCSEILTIIDKHLKP